MDEPSTTGEGEIRFTFEGRDLTAREGQSVAGALAADGVSVLGRSLKLHRPRGYTCGFDACGSCALTVNGLHGVHACSQLVAEGDVVARERGWPSTEHDLLRLGDLFSERLAAGFQFRLFRHHPRLAHQAERVMAHIAGGGRFPTPEAAEACQSEGDLISTGVLIVGAGMSGCLAALAVADEGVRVLLVHRGRLGGRAHLDDTDITLHGANRPVSAHIPQVIERTLAHPGIQVLQGTAIGYYEGGIVPVVADGWTHEVRADHLIVATGSYDVPAAFVGNDRPGVVLADGVSKMLRTEQVVPWKRAVVVGDHDRSRGMAMLLRRSGVEVAAIVDTPGAARLNEDVVQAFPTISGQIQAVRGWRSVRKVRVRSEARDIEIAADLVCIALPPRPQNDLALQWHYVRAGDPSGIDGWGTGDLSRPDLGLTVIGSAADWMGVDPARAMEAGRLAAEAAASRRALREEAHG